MNIAHVICSFDIGGGERVALDLACGQARRGAKVVALSLEQPPSGPMAAEYAAQKVEVLRIPKRGSGIDPTLWPRLMTAFRQFGADVVHTHNPQPLIYGALAARLAGASSVHTKHGANTMPTRRRHLARAAARFCQAFIAVSATTEAQARADRDVATAKLTTIENGIDLSRFAPTPELRRQSRQALGLSPDTFVVGTVGRVVPEKNQPLLVAALAPVLSPRLQLVVVGDGPAAPALKRAVAALGEQRAFVHLLGARTGGELPSLYATFDLFALSSDSEGLPLVVIEAMASGLPVVSTAVGGIPAVVVEGVTGALTPPGDAAALRATIERLAAAPALGLSWGAEGRRRALARYSAERMVDDYFAVYERIRRT